MTSQREEHKLSRAEQLRKQRQQQSQQRFTNVKRQASSTPAQRTVPVTSRSFPYATPARQTYGTTPRKKIYYAVGANGAEMRMPAIPIIHFNWQMISGPLAVILLVVVLLLTNLSTFEIQGVDTVGITRVSAADLVTVLRSNAGSIFTLDRQKAEKALAISFPELTDIHLKVDFPAKVEISARERQPILAWSYKDQTLWIDQDGVVMPVRGDVGSLITIKSNVIPPLTTAVDTSNGALDFSQIAAANKNAADDSKLILPQISPDVLQAAIGLTAQLPEGAILIYDPVNGMGWFDQRGWKVFFGLDLSDLQLKLTEYQSIIDRLTKEGVTPTLISVEFVHAPYYRTE